MIRTTAASLIAATTVLAAEPGVILPMRERAAVVDGLLRERLNRIVPELMREHEVDLWIVLGREYNEDPVLKTMLPATWHSARRRTILVFHDPGAPAEVERLAVSRYAVGTCLRRRGIRASSRISGASGGDHRGA